MKQLTIFCSEELENRVSEVLHKFEIESFIHMPGIFGTRLKPKGSYEKDQTWQATAFVIHTIESKIDKIIQELQKFTSQCEIQPCLRLVVTKVEKII